MAKLNKKFQIGLLFIYIKISSDFKKIIYLIKFITFYN